MTSAWNLPARRWSLATALLTLCRFLVGPAVAGEPALRLAPATSVSLLENGGFEEARTADAKPSWRRAPQGASFVSPGRAGSPTAVACESSAGQGWFGVSQTVTLNRQQALPLRVQGWSKAENVSGGADSNYSLYVDIIYNDGSPSWGHTANFRCGTHDWQERQCVIVPAKPIKSFTLHCLFRGHSGKVWFDDVQAFELKAEGQTTLFHGAPVLRPESGVSVPGSAAGGVAYEDGLELAFGTGPVGRLRVAGQDLLGQAPSGLLARDVAAGSAFYGFEAGRCAALGLEVAAQALPASNHVVVHGRLTDTTGKDRATTLVFALPIDAGGWRWGDDIRRARGIDGSNDYSHEVTVDCGATRTMSLYPMGAIWNDRVGLAIGLDMAYPAQYRVGYHAGTRQFYLAYDFALSPDTDRFPRSAEFRFVVYRFDPAWGFRSAWQKYMAIFAEAFRVRSTQQGLWMPFTDVSTVQDWQDFGFRYHEGNNNVPWDDAHNVLSFRYTEPMTWWMPMDKAAPRTPAQALAIRDELSRQAQGEKRRMATVSRLAAMFDEEGDPALLFQDTPWCNGAVWSLNPNPHLPGDPNAATVHWNPAVKEQLYGAAAQGVLDGEYLDSLEGYVTANLNFRREHFHATTVPLTYSSDSYRPALFKGLAVAEFTRWIAEDAHRLGKLMFANGVPYRFSFLCPWLDVLGTETDWVREGRYQPESDQRMSLWRTLSGAKPYLLLMNTDYDRFAPPLVEQYFQRALFYGMWPGMFSHNAADNPYWKNTRWYNRDRPLFKKYLPLIRRVAEAGWQPVTEARVDNAAIYVERFGPDTDGNLYFTFLNETDGTQTGLFHPSPSARLAASDGIAIEAISGQPLAKEPAGWRLTLASHQAALVALRLAR